jgi:putative SOS response-associated peptidase YedK
MCGRYAITLPPEAMARLFSLEDARANLAPRWNVAPTQPVPIIAIGKDGARKLVTARWGLKPAWMEKDPPTGPLFNARGETLAEKPAFRTAYARKRCLVPADGFYEWKREGKARQPFFITRADGEPMVFAGLWESARDADGAPLVSMSIVTTSANEQMRPLHDRLPVMLEPDAWADWLAAGTARPQLESLLVAPREGALAVRAVSDRVNKVAHDDIKLIDTL